MSHSSYSSTVSVHTIPKTRLLTLLFTEMDLLQMKLESGVQVKTFFPDYNGRNEYEGE
jgi:hypothetical protein